MSVRNEFFNKSKVCQGRAIKNLIYHFSSSLIAILCNFFYIKWIYRYYYILKAILFIKNIYFKNSFFKLWHKTFKTKILHYFLYFVYPLQTLPNVILATIYLNVNCVSCIATSRESLSVACIMKNIIICIKLQI